jgi:hypothetical protein
MKKKKKTKNLINLFFNKHLLIKKIKKLINLFFNKHLLKIIINKLNRKQTIYPI